MTTPSSGRSDDSTIPWSIPAIPTTVELYDLLMKEIEPELVSANVASLAAKYRKESAADAAKRAERYAKAFAEYDRRLTTYIDHLNASIRTFTKAASASLEALEAERQTMDLRDDSSHS